MTLLGERDPMRLIFLKNTHEKLQSIQHGEQVDIAFRTYEKEQQRQGREKMHHRIKNTDLVWLLKQREKKRNRKGRKRKRNKNTDDVCCQRKTNLKKKRETILFVVT